jgi:hypothetical protein
MRNTDVWSLFSVATSVLALISSVIVWVWSSRIRQRRAVGRPEVSRRGFTIRILDEEGNLILDRSFSGTTADIKRLQQVIFKQMRLTE